jgi:hypothetical protein
VAPWTAWWESNYLLVPFPAVRALVLSAIARGLVSGLGLVNILLALHEVPGVPSRPLLTAERA